MVDLDDDTIYLTEEPVTTDKLGRALAWRLFRAPGSSRTKATALSMPDGSLYVSVYETAAEGVAAARSLAGKGYRGIVQVTHEHGVVIGFDTLNDGHVSAFV